MSDQKFFTAQVDLRAERDLRVQIKPRQSSVGPNDEVEVEIVTLDQLDRPVSAEVSLALVDQALLRLYQDRLPPIDQFFYNQTRTHAFQTTSTNTFRYAPSTQPVSDAVVEELERQIALTREVEEKAKRDRGAMMFGMGAVTMNGAPAASHARRRGGRGSTRRDGATWLQQLLCE